MGVTPRQDMEGILNNLARLNLGGEQRPVLAPRAANSNVPKDVPTQAAPGTKKKPADSPDDAVIVISSDEENDTTRQKAAAVRLGKAAQLAELARTIPNTTDNVALARVVREFVGILESSRSRAMTKEGFMILDGLYKQLADPSVYVVPLRTSRTRSGTQQEALPEVDARRAKMDKLFALRRDVAQAKSNRMLAKLVSDFGTCIDKSKGRTLTKDALGFLNNLSERLLTVA